MKSEGFLDDIEKLVDEVWDSEKKQINTHVDREQKKMDMWYDNVSYRQMKAHHDVYKREYLQEVEKRRMWDSPYGDPRRSSTLRHKCGECGIEMKVVYIEDRIDFSRFDPSIPATMMERPIKHDYFYCPRCRQQVNVIGKVLELTINMME